MQQEIDMAPAMQDLEARKVAAAEDKLTLEREKLAQDIAEENSKLSREQRDQQAEVWTAGKQAYEQTGDIAAATEAMQIRAGGKLPEGAAYDDFAADAMLADYATYLKGEDEREPSQLINMYKPETGESIAVRSKSPEADAAAASGFLVGSNSDKVLGLGEAEGGTDLKAADESFILKMVGQYFGGLFNEETQQVNFMDPAKQRKASQITALATNIFADGIEKTRSGSIRRAMKAYGEKWEDPVKEDQGFNVDAAAEELNISVSDLQFTASKRGMSVEEVYHALKNK
jgi:hypothetical protein